MTSIKILRCHKLLAVSATAGLVLLTSAALAAEMSEVIVEAGAPVHVDKGKAASSGATSDLLSVKYHIHMAGFDLSKTADVAKVEEQIKLAAKKGCDTIKAQYPIQMASGEKDCVDAATKGGMAQLKDRVAEAQKPAKK